MKKIINKPYLFFFSLVPLCLTTGYLLKPMGIEIAYLGDEFIIEYWTLLLFSSIFFVLIGANYFALNLIEKQTKR